MKRILAILSILGLSTLALGQTIKSSAVTSITIIAPLTAATVSITPNATSVQAGQTASVVVSVQGTAGTVPTGNVDLLAEAPGQTGYTLVQTFPLVDGAVTCAYPIPANAPLGTYSVKAVYNGDAHYF